MSILVLVAMGCSSDPAPANDGVRTVAMLHAVRTPDSPSGTVFREELARNGYVEGQNLRILGDGEGEVYPDEKQARAAVRRWREMGTEIIVAFSTLGARIASEEAPDTFILFLVNNPVTSGLVQNQMAPEGRLTGVTYRVPEDRTLQLARRTIPELRAIGLAYPPSDPAALPSVTTYSAAARLLGVELLTEEFSGPEDVARAVQALSDRGAQALLLSISPTATRALPEMAAAADQAGLPLIANVDASPAALFTLRPDGESHNRQLARQAVRLLNGDVPQDLPVEDPRRFVLEMNQTVARNLGISIPDDVLREAHHVIR